MRIYRLDNPHALLVADGKMEIAPIANAHEPISGYALHVGPHSHFVELSFEELRMIADVAKDAGRHITA